MGVITERVKGGFAVDINGATQLFPGRSHRSETSKRYFASSQ